MKCLLKPLVTLGLSVRLGQRQRDKESLRVTERTHRDNAHQPFHCVQEEEDTETKDLRSQLRLSNERVGTGSSGVTKGNGRKPIAT